MRNIDEIRKNKLVQILALGEDGGAALIQSIPPLTVIFSWGGGWDHVSVRVIQQNRCPTWEEMCKVKEIFFKNDECVVQYHPPKKDYVNIHPFVLHLWRPQNQEIPMPPKWMV